eukprot:6121547-Amphidinium_carterae.1
MEEWADGSEWQEDWTHTVEGPETRGSGFQLVCLQRSRGRLVRHYGVGRRPERTSTYGIHVSRSPKPRPTQSRQWWWSQILKLHRGGQDINRWITRVEVVLDKAKTAWMELLIVLVPDADVRARASATVNLGRDLALVQIVPDANQIAFARNEMENEIKERHRRSFPIGENLQTLMMIV